MPSLRWSKSAEGSLVLAMAAAALLVYGYFRENLFVLNKGALPGVALLVICAFSLIDFLLNREAQHAELQEYAATGEGSMTIPEIIVAAIMAMIYAYAMLHVGLVVSTIIFITLASWYLDAKITMLYFIVAIIVSSLLWLSFVKGGGTYFGNPILF
ncbi:tripartite tricarboxylate transporter TctB family protein [Pseudochelatococcus sp. B33]